MPRGRIIGGMGKIPDMLWLFDKFMEIYAIITIT
jgi:hypothetical protein